MVPPAPAPKEIGVTYKIAGNILSFDLSGDRLADVMKKITDLTGTNFFIPQTLSEQRLSGYVRDMPFDEAVESLAAMNGLDAEQDENRVWSLFQPEHAALSADGSLATGGAAPVYRRHTPFSPTELSVDSLGMITAQIGRGDVQDVITDLCEQQGLNYYFLSPVSGQTSVWVRGVDFETLLDVLLRGSNFSYYLEDGIYIFGASVSDNRLVAVEKYDMRYRSVNKVSEAIPEALKSGLQVQEFHDLNSVLVSGERAEVARVLSFLRSIDRRVPLVTIEVIIADATKKRAMDIGLDIGFGKSGVESGGTLTGVDVMFNAGSVNSLINSLNGFGSVNLGKVGSGFYLGLQFLEDNGVIELQSTPKLSTLNGHEATLKSGETRYYKEVANNYYGSQTPVSYETFTWKSIDANLEIKITPFVSEDENITLDISIEQTEFTAREAEDAPPGTATRSFQSQIRVQNEDMVLLGGIDQNSREKSNRGLPWISRVPVLRWFFGKSRDSKSERKLNVFIKPTLVE
jgi:type IV pilus assembly protein PilQ